MQFPVRLYHLFSLDEKAGITSSLLVFSEILHEVRHLQRKETNGAEFFKKNSDPWLGAKMAHFGHENQHFLKYLKNGSLDFFIFDMIFEPIEGLKLI